MGVRGDEYRADARRRREAAGAQRLTVRSLLLRAERMALRARDEDVLADELERLAEAYDAADARLAPPSAAPRDSAGRFVRRP